ncbi:MAG: peptidyl-prolyl cis-trans isomerase [Lachnospiraceae bacterium]|nr:peptidyl-prolyl cis-trans isomerase [Lachnospiraceae bacterium]
MSAKNNGNQKGGKQAAEENKEKIVTKYDLKMERRRAAKEQEKKSEKRTATITAVIVIAIVAWIASYPILNYVHRTESWIKVNGIDVSREEFDYYYSNTVNSYLNSYGAYLSYFGLDVNADFATQAYTDTLTWKDYFEQMTVDSLKTYKGIQADASAASFVYDTTSGVEDFKSSLKENAKEAGVSTGEYLKQRFGEYATMGGITKYMAEGIYISAYVDEKIKEFQPTDEEIQDYYDQNKANYDSVDYYFETFYAEISGEDATEEQIETAMNQASADANAALDSITQTGNLMVNEDKSAVSSLYADWLFDEDRSEGDKTVIEDTDGKAYHVLSFVKRYLNEDPTVNAYVLITEDNNGQEILDEWNAGEATVERFQELVKKYDTTGATDGYYENIVPSNMEAEVEEWLSNSARQAGDVGLIVPENSDASYVMYYVGLGEASWKASIINILSNQSANEYEEQVAKNVVVEDSKGHLNYLKVETEQNAQTEQDEQGEQTEIVTE